MRFNSIKAVALFTMAVLFSGCASSKPYYLKWERHKLDGLFSSVRSSLQSSIPVAYEGNLYFGTRTGRLIGVNSDGGRLIWSKQLGGAFEAEGVVDEKGHFYIGNVDGRLIAIDLQSGDELWSFKADGELLSKPAVTKDSVLFLTSYNQLVALSKSNGEVIWRHRENPPEDLSYRGISSPVVDEKLAQVYIGFSSGLFVALNVDSGALVWRQNIATADRYNDIDADAVVIDSMIYISSVTGPLMALDSLGKLSWIQESVRTQTAIKHLGDKLFAISLDGSVQAIQRADGQVVWKTMLKRKQEVPLTLALRANNLLVGMSNGDVHVVDLESGRKTWTYKIGREVSGSIFADQRGFFTINENQTLFHFEESS